MSVTMFFCFRQQPREKGEQAFTALEPCHGARVAEKALDRLAQLRALDPLHTEESLWDQVWDTALKDPGALRLQFPYYYTSGFLNFPVDNNSPAGPSPSHLSPITAVVITAADLAADQLVNDHVDDYIYSDYVVPIRESFYLPHSFHQAFNLPQSSDYYC